MTEDEVPKAQGEREQVPCEVSTPPQGASNGKVTGAPPGPGLAESPGSCPTSPIGPGSVRSNTGLSLLAGTVVEGRYRFRLGQILGGGRLGRVFLAECLDHRPEDPESPPARVALKVFFPPQLDEAAAMLRRELSSLLAFEYDHVPQVYDWKIGEPFCYVAMQYFPGGSVDEWLRKSEQIDEAMAWQMLEDVLSVLQAAHNASILHLDIKPANILFDGQGGFVLTDFGISQGLMAAHFLPEAGLGTTGYRAPEQDCMEWDQFDERTDLWSLGATVWSMLTGIVLWQRDDLLLYRSTSEKYGLPRPSMFRPHISPELENVVMSLVATRADDRPGSAAEMLTRVERRGVGGGRSGECREASGSPCGPEALQKLLQELLDPLWISVVGDHRLHPFLWQFADGERLCREGDRSYCIFILLKGSVEILRGGTWLTAEQREGTFLGEVAALTGGARTATVRARGSVYALRFNPAQLERLVALEPALAIRLIKSLAERVARESQAENDDSATHP